MTDVKEFILVFDLPREMGTVKVRAWRELQRMEAKMVQFSIWKSEKLDDLMKLALDIKKEGGDARILEERFVF
ncbi:MAG: hypothetical protein HYW24_04355 [Candidatus Aenigmarchaeota archaeon]|nr:hypothetical protein [Candidatus Aenigmarchaeota archaeon]